MFTSDIDFALLAKLSGDAALKAFMPDGVHWDIATAGKTRIVIVKLMDHRVSPMFRATAFEEPLYLVKAVEFTLSAANVVNAARRIDALLNGQPLTITGGALMLAAFEEYVRYTEPDTTNPDGRWQHCGGLYRLSVSPN